MGEAPRPYNGPDLNLPRVSARIDAVVAGFSISSTGRLRITLEAEDFNPEWLLRLARTRKDGPQDIVFVSLNPEQVIPGTEEAMGYDDAEMVAVGYQLTDALVTVLKEQADRETGRIEVDPDRKGIPAMPTGTYVGKTDEEISDNVRPLVQGAPRAAAEAAGSALRRGKGRSRKDKEHAAEAIV